MRWKKTMALRTFLRGDDYIHWICADLEFVECFTECAKNWEVTNNFTFLLLTIFLFGCIHLLELDITFHYLYLYHQKNSLKVVKLYQSWRNFTMIALLQILLTNFYVWISEEGKTKAIPLQEQACLTWTIDMEVVYIWF